MTNDTYSHDKIFPINGAAVFAELEDVVKNGKRTWQTPGVNKEYKYALYQDDMFWVSKDCIQWVVAICVYDKYTLLSSPDIDIPATEEEMEDVLNDLDTESLRNMKRIGRQWANG